MKVFIIFEKFFILREQSEFLFYPVFQLKKRWNKGFPKIHDADKVRKKGKRIVDNKIFQGKKKRKKKEKDYKRARGEGRKL